jgi:hypothetical protein
MGFGLAAAIPIDATTVRAVLLPSGLSAEERIEAAPAPAVD